MAARGGLQKSGVVGDARVGGRGSARRASPNRRPRVQLLPRYRVWVHVERSENGDDDTVALGPPECIFEATSRAVVVRFLRTLPGDSAESTVKELRGRG